MKTLAANVTMAPTPMATAARRFEKAFALTWPRLPIEHRNAIANYLEQYRRSAWCHLCFQMELRGGTVEPWASCGLAANEVCLAFSASVLRNGPA